MQSLRFKILATAAVLVLVSQAGTVAIVLFTANGDVSGRAEQSLVTGAEVLRNATTSRASQLGNTVRALASDYGFKEAIGTNDANTVSSALANHAQRAGADLAFILDDDKQLLANTDSTAQLLLTLSTSQSRRIFSKPGRHVQVFDGYAYEIFTVPVKAPLPIAWLSMGFKLDDAFTRQLHDLAGLEVTLIAQEEDGDHVLASSWEHDSEAALINAGSLAENAHTPMIVKIGDDDQLVSRSPLIVGQAHIYLLITKSLAEAMAPYELLKKASFALGTLPLLAALIGAVLLSRALTEPVNRLMQAAKRIRSGDYDTPVEIRSGDELSEFGTAFNAMQIEIAARENRILHQAQHDLVTGLYNGDYALELLKPMVESAWKIDASVGLMIIRLNAFNDLAGTLGHDVAEIYLAEVARKISRFIDPDHLLARLDNDDFLVALVENESECVRDVAGELADTLKAGIKLPAINIAVRPTIGIATFPRQADKAESLMLRATIALNQAVTEGRAIRLYQEGDQENRVRNMNLLQDLPRAAQADELRLHCQPKISLTDETVCGVEALVRWEHPEYGWLPPDSFIPLIENSGNISIITRWVIEKAAKQLAEWQSQNLDLNIAVNLSARDLLDDDLPWFVTDVLKQHGITPGNLVLEVTEEAMIEDFATASSTLQRLNDLGLPISIDDFGTGYSSLSQLKLLPVQELKIDRSFIANLPDDPADVAIVESSVDMAHKLGLKIVAEGVSSSAACRWLKEHGVDRAQGFYWSKPMPANEVRDWLAKFEGGSTQQVKSLKLI